MKEEESKEDWQLIKEHTNPSKNKQTTSSLFDKVLYQVDAISDRMLIISWDEENDLEERINIAMRKSKREKKAGNN